MMKNPAVNGFLYRHWRSSVAILFLVTLGIVGFFVAFLFDSNYSMIGNLSAKAIIAGFTSNNYAVETRKQKPSKKSNQIEIIMSCSSGNTTVGTCPTSYYPSNFPAEQQNEEDPEPIQQPSCPEYFRWIHEDLMPWRETGITLNMVEMGRRRKPHFRLVIVNGTAYVETFKKSFQTRDIFTQWGILQLLRRYPGKIPDLDIMFNCADHPGIFKGAYLKWDSSAPPPPLFGYDADDGTMDIIFPDWSFWGWPEIHIKPWESFLKDLIKGNEGRRWMDREPRAYWKGAVLSKSRKDLLSCNASGKHDWDVLIYSQDWRTETDHGFKNSNLASQCNHRYKIYIEGRAWSVSEKYILACDSVTLLVKPQFYDFFTRGLIPLQHYWPISSDDKCRSIKHAVDWGNTHHQEAQAIGKAASNFVQEEMQMKYIYDYMFHLLTEYAKLLKYKPSVPPNAIELCSESLVCPAEGLMKEYMMDSVVRRPSDTAPCTMLPPYDPAALHSVFERKENSIKQVEKWEKQYWDRQNTSKLI